MRVDSGRDTDDIDELYESEVEADVDDVSEVLHGSDERVVAVEQIVDKTHFVVAAETFINTTVNDWRVSMRLYY